MLVGGLLIGYFVVLAKVVEQKIKDVSVKSHRPETRTGCCAMMRINGRYTRNYKVVNFIADHNGHDLVSPSKTHFLRLHRRITDVQAQQADDISSSRIAPKAGYYLMSKQVGGRENVGFIFEDLQELSAFQENHGNEDRLIDERRYQELKADLRTCHSTPVASFPVEILKHAASVYTHEVFELFQNELRKAYDSQIELCGEIEKTSEYKITPFRKHYQHTVMYDSSQEVEVKLENMTAISPYVGRKSVVKKALVSRVDEKQSIGVSLVPENAFDDGGLRSKLSSST
ncbi:UNVERIFIED_CONTAM: hypothetical protein Scaly_2557100 [Sesamum calycinum]|uniref:FAR1 domain-containing protein n=1 Tax=Sesamum calycinum TaxID=2727403 RepID=A0AAW2L7B8_9LAMI